MAKSESTGGQSVSTGQVRLERIYLKDSSFESPRSPGVFAEAWKPEMQLEVNARSNTLENNRYEVVLTVTLRAKGESGKTAFIIEVQQAGLFVIEGIEDDVLQRVLATVCPNTLFPYVRESVDSMAVRGGFPAIQLAPMNFDAAYADAVKKKSPAEDVTH
ncbi:MAG: protein-export chaperone SecB [Pseudomonadales bacterium]|jgi:preprotein translocase subunit SecB